MIRLIIEAGLIFLAPALLYLAAGVIRRRAASRGRGRSQSIWREVKAVLDGAPYVWLFFSGAALLLLSLLAVGTPPSGSPDQHYEPARIEDGKVKQGHFE